MKTNKPWPSRHHEHTRLNQAKGGWPECSPDAISEIPVTKKLIPEQRKIKVLVLTTSFPLSRDSVSGVFVRRLVEALPDTVETTVLTPCTLAPLRDRGNRRFSLRCFRYAPWRWQVLAHLPGGIPVALRQSRKNLLLVPWFLAAMLWATLRASAETDIIHANWSISGFIAGLAARLRKKPLMTTLRGEDVSRAETSAIYRLMLRGCMRNSRHIAAVSDAMAERMRAMFPHYAHKVLVLPNGVSPQLLSIDERPETVAAPPHLRLLVVGSLIPRKGVDIVIKALAGLCETGGAYLTIVGDGGERRSLESLAKQQGVEDSVEFVGETGPDQVASYYESADVFVLASYSEGRPNVVLEAMASALPVVAGDIEGVNELIVPGENGLLFEPGSVQDLVRQLQRVSADSGLRRQLGSRARQFIVEHGLLWRNTGEKYATLYRKAVSGND